MDTMIGSRIKERRKFMHLTGAQIKEKTGISTGNLSDIENGKSLPSAIAIIQLSQILECSTDYLLLGKTRESEFDKYSDSRVDLLINYFWEMSLTDQDDILLIAEMKANKRKRNSDIKSSISESSNILTETA